MKTIYVKRTLQLSAKKAARLAVGMTAPAIFVLSLMLLWQVVTGGEPQEGPGESVEVTGSLQTELLPKIGEILVQNKKK